MVEISRAARGHRALNVVCIGHRVVVLEAGVARELVELLVLPATVVIRGRVQIFPQVALTQPVCLKAL